MLFINPNKAIKYVIDDSYPRLNAKQLAEIEEVWSKKISENPSYFNGTAFSSSILEESDTEYTVSLHSLEFKVALWATTVNNAPIGCTNIGAGVFIYDDTNLYLIKRSAQSYTNVGKLSCVVGGVDYKEGAEKDFFSHLRAIILKELEEEVVLRSSISEGDLEFIGATYIKESGKMTFRYKAKGEITKVANGENTQVVSIPISEVTAEVKNNPTLFSDTDIEFLCHPGMATKYL